MSNFKIGDHVKIFSKSVPGYGDLHNSAIYKRSMNGAGWITELNPEGPGTYTVHDTKGDTGGDYFQGSDLQLINEGGAPMARRTFKLIKELPELTKGALVQEKCDDGDQDYTVLDQSFIKYEDEHGRKSITYPRKAVEEEPTWFTEVFKVSPEYMTQYELDQFEAFKAAQTPKRGRKPNSTTAKATRTKKVTKAA